MRKAQPRGADLFGQPQWCTKVELGLSLCLLDPFNALLALGLCVHGLTEPLHSGVSFVHCTGMPTSGDMSGLTCSHVLCSRAGPRLPRGCVQRNYLGLFPLEISSYLASSYLGPLGRCPFHPHLPVQCLEAPLRPFPERLKGSAAEVETHSLPCGHPVSLTRQGVFDPGTGKAYLQMARVCLHSQRLLSLGTNVQKTWLVLLALPHVPTALDHSL